VGLVALLPLFSMKGGSFMGKIDWDVVTNFTDAVTTTLKTVTFPKVQEQVYLRNQGNANFTYTIGSQSGTLTPGQSVTVNQDVSSFTLQAVSGTHTFELRAKEKGTDQSVLETDSYNYNVDGSVQSITTTDNKNNVIKTVTYIYNASGDVISSVTVANNETVTTIYNYDTSGNITSTANVIS
jgi:YD repeat-containing protein